MYSSIAAAKFRTRRCQPSTFETAALVPIRRVRNISVPKTEEINMHSPYRLYGFLACLAALAQSTLPMFSQVATPWVWRNPYPVGTSLRAATFANGFYVLVGDRGTIVTSADGINWKIENSPTLVNLTGIASGNGVFVAVGAEGTVLTSMNATDWTAQSSLGSNHQLNGVAYGDGKFVAVGYDQICLTSLDGILWKPMEGLSSSSLAVCYGNGGFISVGFRDLGPACGRQGLSFALTSPFESWKQVLATGSICTDLSFGACQYGNGIYLVVGGPGLSSTSRDGAKWDTRGTLSGRYFHGICLGDGIFIVVGDGGEIWLTADSVVWQLATSGTSLDLYGACYGNKYVVIGRDGALMTSSFGTRWTSPSYLGGKNLLGVATSPSRLIAAGPGAFLASTNGTVWSELKSNLPDDALRKLTGVAFGNDTYVITTGDGAAFTSHSASEWERRDTSAKGGLTRLQFVNGSFVGFGDGSIYVSTDGVAWTATEINPGHRIFAMTVGDDGTRVVVGSGGTLFSSGDGANWTAFPTGNGSDLHGVAYGNKLFIAIGDNGIVWTSSDGFEWRLRASSGYSLQSVAFVGGRFVAVGGGGLLASLDGKTWESVAPTPGFDRNLSFVLSTGDSAFAVGDRGAILQASGVAASALSPVITTQPTTQLITLGGDATLVVEAGGPGPLSYQWFLNGVAVPGATSSALILRAIDLARTGKYTVKVSNQSGSVTSVPAILVGTPRLEVGMYAGIALEGTVGQTYSIEYTTDLQDSSTPWKPLDQISLTNVVQVWFDLESPGARKRFYRATPVF